ncbi:GTPase ObgE [Candidatus Magnetomoraceae bacterium gMMP-1]
MKFIDETIITVQSGNGGRGCVSFRREKFIPRGGPNGGDGGKGGDIVFKTSYGKRTLYNLTSNRHFKAPNGGHGQGSQKTGKSGKDLVLEIPVGTIVINAENDEIIKDFTVPDEFYIIAGGGRGGQGNKRFTSSTNRSPRFAQPGEPGQILKLKLELKLLADIGLIGLPNAGKSTLISVLSSARPKIASYPFTTLTPSLGVVNADLGEPYVIADIPGLIEGAHKGTGLGIRFLRHIERTRFLVHLIDASEIDLDNPLSSYETINNELLRYDAELGRKPQIVVLNKMDLPEAKKAADIFEAAGNDLKILRISAVTGQGIEKLKKELFYLVENSL